MGLARVLPANEVSEANVLPGDCRFSSEGACRLVTYGLGSDVVVTVHAPQVGLSALLRFVYPDSRLDPDQASENPWLFADTGIPLLLSTLRKCGASHQDIEVQAIGGANVAEPEASDVNGRSNELALRKALWAEGVLLKSEDLGGDTLRAVWFDSATARLMVRSDTRRAKAAEAVAGQTALQYKAS